ncbi:hypothetical protein Nepgr_015259 [Nepenthes gracilis]|uniref:Uncharacterized protein n=1 Tax=Nepenthes gracilis TaxID=150966 RepID=A0AAD3SLF0_NEPGR|nr:hypothetical protein Nepgr_015259 [Nepenthes gracilis]
MWGDVEKLYWERSVQNDAIKGIVVIFGWVSLQEMHLKNYVDLYSSFGWNSLICYPNFLNAFFPEKATSLAFLVLNELIKELRIRPYPIVFASFSGGPKACLYKVIQLIDGTSAAPFNPDDKQLVQKCICGNIYDSSPTDCRSNLCSLFTHHPWSLKIPYSTKLLSSVAKGVASGLDALFLARFVLQDNEYWHTLCSSINSELRICFYSQKVMILLPVK